MSAEDQVSAYNYSAFEGREEFLAFRQIAQVGSKAPDFDVIDAESGVRAPISDRWRGRDLLIEFGSLT
jgi:hypothetical protein